MKHFIINKCNITFNFYVHVCTYKYHTPGRTMTQIKKIPIFSYALQKYVKCMYFIIRKCNINKITMFLPYQHLPLAQWPFWLAALKMSYGLQGRWHFMAVKLFTNPVSKHDFPFQERSLFCKFSQPHSICDSESLFFPVLWSVLLQVCKSDYCYHSLYHFWFDATVYEPYSNFLMKAVLKRNKAGQTEEKKLVQMKIRHSELVEERCEEKTEKK